MSLEEFHVGSSSTPFVEADKSLGVVREVRCFSNPEFSASVQADEDQNICWICLESDTPSRPLKQPCKCPRYCHLRCLARWQLQSAGTRREFHCDFCNSRLPDWRHALSMQNTVNAPAIMNVNFEGKTYSFEVKPGPLGYLHFTEAIRQAFQLPPDSELNITFTCDEPCNDEGSLLTLQGPGAFDAAVYCASVSAARRQIGHRRAHTISGTRALNDPDGTMAMEQGRGHHRSHTVNEVARRAGRQEEASRSPVRPPHRRSRSAFFPLGRTLRNNGSTEQPPSRGIFRVVKKVRALYHRLTRK